MIRSLSKRSFWSELKVAYALSKKEFIYYTRYPLNPVFDFITFAPVVFTYVFLGFTLVGGPNSFSFERLTGTQDYISYILIGMIINMYTNSSIGTVGGSLREEMLQGCLESCWMAPIKRFTLLTGRIFFNLVFISAIALGNAAIIWATLSPKWSVPLLPLVCVVGMMLICNYSLGILTAGLMILHKKVGPLVGFMSSLITFFSGAYFPITLLPEWIRWASYLIPSTYVIKETRQLLLLGQVPNMFLYDMVVLAIASCLFIIFSYTVFKKLERRARRLGTIAYY